MALPEGFHRRGSGILFYFFEYYLECFSVYCFYFRSVLEFNFSSTTISRTGHNVTLLDGCPSCVRMIHPEITYLLYLLTFFLSYLLLHRARVLLEKLTGSQLVKKFPTFLGTQKFITAFTGARHLSLS